MTVVRLGTTKRYADNWDNIFGGAARRSTAKKKAVKSSTAARKSAKKRPARIAASKPAKAKSLKRK